MFPDFRGKRRGDVESASETLVSGSSYTSNILSRINSNSNMNKAKDRGIDDNVDAFTEKRNKA